MDKQSVIDVWQGLATDAQARGDHRWAQYCTEQAALLK